MDRISTSKLVGKKVNTSDGIELGDVLGVELQLSDWTAERVIIRLHRSLTDRFHIDAPFVMGTKAISLQPSDVASVDDQVLLCRTLEEAVLRAVVSYDTDATNHL